MVSFQSHRSHKSRHREKERGSGVNKEGVRRNHKTPIQPSTEQEVVESQVVDPLEGWL